MPVKIIKTNTSPEVTFRTFVVVNEGSDDFDTGAAEAHVRFLAALKAEGIDPDDLRQYTALATVVRQGVVEVGGEAVNLWQRRQAAFRWDFTFTIPTQGTRVEFVAEAPVPENTEWLVRQP